MDDIIVTGTNLDIIQSTIKELISVFALKELGDLHYFVRVEVTKVSDGVILSQRK